jgi:hypothetical protein
VAVSLQWHSTHTFHRLTTVLYSSSGSITLL